MVWKLYWKMTLSAKITKLIKKKIPMLSLKLMILEVTTITITEIISQI